MNTLAYLRRSPSSVRNTVQSSSFLRGSVFAPLSLSEEILRGSGGMWVGLVGDCTYNGNFSVEKDLGTGGIAGIFEMGTGAGSVEALKRPLSLFDFLVSTRFLGVVGLSVESLALDFSGMLSAAVKDLRLVASTLNEFFLGSSTFTGLVVSFGVSFVGDDGLDCDDTQLFLRSFVSDRTGELELEESACFTLSLRLRSGFGSAEGSRLLLEKGRNLDDRRERLGRNCGICTTWGPSSDSGLEPPEDE